MIIDANEIFKKYDFSSTITANDNKTAINCIKDIIDGGNYFTNSPRYQTKENIFARTEPIWLKYRMSFLFSVFMYLGKEVRVSNMMAWSFVTSLKNVEDRENLWHNHAKPGSNKLSGIFYLHIPDDVADRDTCGTEMAVDGPKGSDKLYVRPSEYSWLIYPSEIWHRPGIVQSQQDRFIIAVDVEYQ
jgi:hypothetical protein